MRWTSGGKVVEVSANEQALQEWQHDSESLAERLLALRKESVHEAIL